MEKMAVNVRRYLIISSILVLAASAAGCGSGGERPGANGGTIATGGTTATGGSTGAAGILCPPGVTPSSAEITNFSSTEWNETTDKFGTGNTLGGIFSYGGAANAGSTMTSTVDTTNQALVLSGSVTAGDYSGGGLSFDECVNASAYSGVQFTLGGTTAGCDLIFDVQTFDQKPSGKNQVGGCTGSCYSFPGTKLTTTSGVVSVPFANLSGGGPLVVATAINDEIVGLQWQFQSPAPVGDGGQLGCPNINLTITNVSFVP